MEGSTLTPGEQSTLFQDVLANVDRMARLRRENPMLVVNDVGEVRELGAYESRGRSMFGPVSIQTSPNVPEGTALLVDRDAMLNPLRITGLHDTVGGTSVTAPSLDRVGSVYGLSRAPGETDNEFRERVRHTLLQPVSRSDETPAPAETQPSSDEKVSLLRRLIDRFFPRRAPSVNESEDVASLNVARPSLPERYNCYMCGVYGDRHMIRANGMCRACADVHQRQRWDATRRFNEVFPTIKDRPGPTAEEMEANYRV